ncbi:MAG: HAMP domain-containing protein [Clostridia bacterium]|nr:HAMP domain-containing protein [Clostridia bacterium]
MAFYVVTASLIRLVGEYLFSQKVSDEQRMAGELAVALSEPFADRDAERLYSDVRSASESTGGRIMVLDLYGVVQADTYSEYNGTQLMRSEVAMVLSGGGEAYGFYESPESGAGSFLLPGLTVDMIGLYAAPIMADESMAGVLVFITLAQDMYQSLMYIQTQMILWLVLVALAVAILSLFVSRFFTKPVSNLITGMSQMTRGDFSGRVKVKGKSEFAQLASTFNMMCDRLESLDKSRSQFVSNASHELKTPLSTMKILIETLVYQEPMDEGMCREFLGDINKEIDRLNLVINDLLTLVSMDSGEMKVNMKSASLTDMLNETMRRLQPLARERGIEMSAAIAQGVTVNCDPMKLTQVFYNLMDNAIKYTGRGGEVKIELVRKDKKAIARVIDTGIGIPKEDQMHIFDRFYRVDKARSRETGGTGLGLSIVKQVVLLHGGDITVSSEEEKGSTFTVELPLQG